MIASILSDHLVLLRAKAGVEVNRENATEANRLISDAMPGDYGEIIDRQEDYSLAPVEVYGVLNQVTKLKAIAIVVHREGSLATAAIGKHLYRNPIAIFTDLQEAKDWLEETLRLAGSAGE